MSALDKFQCVHCGAARFQTDSDGLLRCNYCGSTYRRKAETGPKLVIGSGANVTIGRGGRVQVEGSVQVEDGAQLEVLGELELVTRASPGSRR
ncbi:hypothetical protein [Arenimonas sp.]|uniref:hypothetical protein n=1 Tax=Arenimonas sp. TaxID=1872635 RepID=UPI0039E5C928